MPTARDRLPYRRRRRWTRGVRYEVCVVHTSKSPELRFIGEPPKSRSPYTPTRRQIGLSRLNCSQMTVVPLRTMAQFTST